MTNISYRGYSADGQMLSAEYGNGVAELREYDQQGRLVGKELIDTSGFFVEERIWTYDPAGNVVERTRSSTTETFSYDPLDRLVGQAITGASNASWSYDYGPNHNPLSRQLEGEFGEDYAYQPQSNRLLRRTRPTPASSPPDGIYQRKSNYNQAGRLSEYLENGAVKGRYTYNTFGLRTRKATDAGTTVFHYHTGITLLGESDEAGNATRDYIWLNGSPVAAVDAGGTVVYIHTDHLLTPRLATDASAAIVWSWDGEAFGDAEPTGSLTLNLRFPGQYFDAESGRNYNVMRDYNAALSYVQSDPVGLRAGLATYSYAESGPLTKVDPLGLLIKSALGALCQASVESIDKQRKEWDESVNEAFNQALEQHNKTFKLDIDNCIKDFSEDKCKRNKCIKQAAAKQRKKRDEAFEFQTRGLNNNIFDLGFNTNFLSGICLFQIGKSGKPRPVPRLPDAP